MTSKEALDSLVAETRQNIKCLRYESIIKKDLNTLEILKSWFKGEWTNIVDNELSCSDLTDNVKEELLKIKEWIVRD